MEVEHFVFENHSMYAACCKLPEGTEAKVHFVAWPFWQGPLNPLRDPSLVGGKLLRVGVEWLPYLVVRDGMHIRLSLA